MLFFPWRSHYSSKSKSFTLLKWTGLIQGSVHNDWTERSTGVYLGKQTERILFIFWSFFFSFSLCLFLFLHAYWLTVSFFCCSVNLFSPSCLWIAWGKKPCMPVNKRVYMILSADLYILLANVCIFHLQSCMWVWGMNSLTMYVHVCLMPWELYHSSCLVHRASAHCIRIVIAIVILSDCNLILKFGIIGVQFV